MPLCSLYTGNVINRNCLFGGGGGLISNCQYFDMEMDSGTDRILKQEAGSKLYLASQTYHILCTKGSILIMIILKGFSLYL